MSSKTTFLLGILPLVIYGESIKLEDVIITEKKEMKTTFKEEQFFKSYSKKLITKEDIKEKGISNTKDALKSISNVKVKDLGAFNKSVSIRGFSGERVVSLVDGVKISNHGITMAGGGEIGLVEPSSIEKIEIIKGSPSILFDPGAIGGIINIVTIKDLTHQKDKVKLKYDYLFDDSYLLNSHVGFFETKYKDLYFNISKTVKKSKNLNVKNREKLFAIIEDTNLREERKDEKYKIKDLGYEGDSLSGRIAYQINENSQIFFKSSKNNIENANFTYGNSSPRVFHYDEYNKKNWMIGLKTNNLLHSKYLNAFYSKQNIYRMVNNAKDIKTEVKLESKSTKIESQFLLKNILLSSGFEHINDEAKTLTFSTQKYNALYLQGEYIFDNLTFFLGSRYNHYKVTQQLLPGKRKDTIYDLVGVSGVIKEPIKNDKINYSAGIVYSINENNNISFNFSKSYRYPSLYERFAYDTFIGGGLEIKPEIANNYEITFKHLDDSLDYNLALFYSDFKTYNSTYEYKSIKNKAAFEECNKNPDCDPFDGDVNERNFFDSSYIYSSFDNVKSYGFEFNINKTLKDYNTDLGFNIGMTKILDGEKKFDKDTFKIEFSQEPIEFSSYIKKRFDNQFNPWVKIDIRHVTDSSNVKQDNGYSPFTVANLYFGGKYKNFTLNAGVKNLTNTVYHEPYMLLDGTKRSFFLNLSIDLEKLL